MGMTMAIAMATTAATLQPMVPPGLSLDLRIAIDPILGHHAERVAAVIPGKLDGPLSIAIAMLLLWQWRWTIDDNGRRAMADATGNGNEDGR